MLNRTQLVHYLSKVPRDASVQRFVDTLIAGLGTGTPQQPQQIQFDQIMIGNKLRIRALPNGGVIEVIGIDGLWHAQAHFTLP